MKMWAGRFREPVDQAFDTWQRSFPFDQRLLPQELAASRAYARALAKAGVLEAEELTSLLDGLDQIEKETAGKVRRLEESRAEDVHHYVELRLTDLVGEVGLKLHAGRSRNEQIATDLRLFAREQLDQIRAQLADLIEAFLGRAAEQEQIPMPAYTHLQPAEPVLVAHWLMAYGEMCFRDLERLRDCRERLNVLPLGSGAVAGAPLPLDRAAMARELGFTRISANSIDATSDRDFLLEFLHALVLVMLHLSRWAEETVLFTSREFGFLELPESLSTGSSAMPQKKNPDLAELLRGKVGRVVGAAASVTLTLKALPLAYDKDLQETQEPLFDAVDTVKQALVQASAFVRVVRFRRDRLETTARTGFLNATACAQYLVRQGVPFRKAHTAVAKAVEHSLERNCELEDLTLEELRQASPAFQADVREHLTLEAVLASHDLPGGTHPRRVAAALREARERLANLRKELHADA
jgi:argininosuccinate lyase